MPSSPGSTPGPEVGAGSVVASADVVPSAVVASPVVAVSAVAPVVVGELAWPVLASPVLASAPVVGASLVLPADASLPVVPDAPPVDDPVSDASLVDPPSSLLQASVRLRETVASTEPST